jgi:hypothetical protein
MTPLTREAIRARIDALECMDELQQAISDDQPLENV